MDFKHQALRLTSCKSLAEKKAMDFKHQALRLTSCKSLAEKKALGINSITRQARGPAPLTTSHN
jgi:hypothetical protein